MIFVKKMFYKFFIYVIIVIVYDRVNGCDTYMSKALLRFCVYVYKGLLFIATIFLKLFKAIFYVDNKEEISKYKKKIKAEKTKQKRIEEREAAIEKKKKLKQEKIDKKRQRKLDKKNARVARIEEKKRKYLEKQAKKSKKKPAVTKTESKTPKVKKLVSVRN